MSETDNQALQVDEPAATDNSAPVDQSEASTQTDEAPEATQVKEETPELNATDKAEESLLLGKFKTPEELATAYQQLESKSTKDAMEKAELSRILNEAFVPPEATPQATQTDADDFADEPNPLNQEIEALKRQTAVQGFIMNHQDADAASMQQVLSSDPLVKQISGHEAKLEYAYLKSQGMTQQKAIAEAEKKGAEQAHAKVAEKQTAQVETATKTAEQTDEKAELQERMSTGPLEQREKARREYIRKYLV